MHVTNSANVITQQGAPWGLKRLTSNSPVTDATPGYIYNTNACGQGVNIYVLDDYIRGTHDEFNEPGGGGRRIMVPGGGAVGPTYENHDPHGTFAAGIAAGLTYGVAKSANVAGLLSADIENLRNQARRILVHRKRWNLDGSPRPADANPRPAVLNVSNSYPITDARVTRFYVELIKAGVHVVIAAGNENVRREANWAFDSLVDGEHVVVPEDDREHVHSVIWVGASMQNDRKWPRSNYGPLIDLFAPGEAILSAANGHDAAFKLDSGTSFAAPHVTGIIACLLSDPLYTGLTPAEMKHKILEMAWPDQVERVTVPDLLQHVVWRDLSGVITELQYSDDIENWPQNSAAVQATLQQQFVEKASLNLTNDYIQNTLLPLLAFLQPGIDQKTEDEVFEVLTEDLNSVQTAINGLVEGDILAPIILAFRTTTKLASCRLQRWALGN